MSLYIEQVKLPRLHLFSCDSIILIGFMTILYSSFWSFNFLIVYTGRLAGSQVGGSSGYSGSKLIWSGHMLPILFSFIFFCNEIILKFSIKAYKKNKTVPIMCLL